MSCQPATPAEFARWRRTSWPAALYRWSYLSVSRQSRRRSRRRDRATWALLAVTAALITVTAVIGVPGGWLIAAFLGWAIGLPVWLRACSGDRPPTPEPGAELARRATRLAGPENLPAAALIVADFADGPDGTATWLVDRVGLAAAEVAWALAADFDGTVGELARTAQAVVSDSTAH